VENACLDHRKMVYCVLDNSATWKGIFFHSGDGGAMMIVTQTAHRNAAGFPP